MQKKMCNKNSSNLYLYLLVYGHVIAQISRMDRFPDCLNEI